MRSAHNASVNRDTELAESSILSLANNPASDTQNEKWGQLKAHCCSLYKKLGPEEAKLLPVGKPFTQLYRDILSESQNVSSPKGNKIL